MRVIKKQLKRVEILSLLFIICTHSARHNGMAIITHQFSDNSHRGRIIYRFNKFQAVCPLLTYSLAHTQHSRHFIQKNIVLKKADCFIAIQSPHFIYKSCDLFQLYFYCFGYPCCLPISLLLLLALPLRKLIN